MGENVLRAAGALLWRDGATGPELAVVHRPKYDDWSFPKGKVKNGEHVLRAAVREVTEETGIVPVLGRRLPSASYPKDDRIKRVDYWAARGPNGAPFVANDEVDRLEWLGLEAAGERLSYAHDAEVLRDFAEGPRFTWPLVILRHATAGEKSAWREPDELRPLDESGRADATDLAATLGAFGPAVPRSSATARCVETLLPYARVMGADVTTDRAFTVGDGDLERARDALAALVTAGAPAIVCTHGEIVADLVAELCRNLGEKVPEEPTLRKGSFWVAHLTGRGDETAMAALEHHDLRRT
ncbi:NUDIX hydrolase [Spirillospora sp. CA-294931]|uniref:NUDIX hydrolase n=1 Tax=Spirillospora sp. CA-294931 TaxID=3240042 RepID=UPI003D8BE5DD